MQKGKIEDLVGPVHTKPDIESSDEDEDQADTSADSIAVEDLSNTTEDLGYGGEI